MGEAARLMPTLVDVSQSLQSTAAQVAQIARDHPDWTAERNQRRNFAMFDGDGNYVGYIDMIWGDVQIEGRD